MPSRTVLSTSCSSHDSLCYGHFQGGIGPIRTRTDHSRAPPSFSTLNRFAPPITRSA